MTCHRCRQARATLESITEVMAGIEGCEDDVAKAERVMEAEDQLIEARAALDWLRECCAVCTVPMTDRRMN